MDENVPEGLRGMAVMAELQSAIINISLNALRHGFSGREAGRLTFAGRRGAGVVCLDIWNDGNPIPGEVASELLLNPINDSPGNGIGLYVAARNLRAFGADMSFDSGQEGTRFTITLPAAEISMIVPKG